MRQQQEEKKKATYMKFVKQSAIWFVLGNFMVSMACWNARAEAGRAQTIPLRVGWNAVFLEVQPSSPQPSAVFDGLPIDIVARFFAQNHPAPYIRNPGDAPWREEGWGVWYAPSRPDAVLSSLHSMAANHAYLIHASADCVWSVTGSVAVRPLRWQPDSYNFVGFALDAASPPTFASFFAPSKAHRNQPVYRLSNGVWTPVRDPATQKMQSGEAYWVYCAGGSDYQGPLQVRVPGGILDLGAATLGGRIEFVNSSGAPMQLVVETVSSMGSLPLAYLNEDLSTLSRSFPAMPSRLDLPTIPAGRSQFLRVAARRDSMSSKKESALLRVSNEHGVQLWVPVTAEQRNN